jgi:hypothetical protein
MVGSKTVEDEAISKMGFTSDTTARLITSFVFRYLQFWRRSYQNQLSFSGKDSTAVFFFFPQNVEKRKSKNGKKSSHLFYLIVVLIQRELNRWSQFSEQKLRFFSKVKILENDFNKK